MKDFKICSDGNFLKVETGFGTVHLDLGRVPTCRDAETIHEIMNLGARLYAEKIREARLEVDSLINWRINR